ncbi:ATP-dependent DNA helicase UvrD2 [Microlunatus phosphovorus NM-1]|uniref:DNA 3'-5' helicase n=1 Tax=Microlunatus phosphovorus (strain ATCC 700054 / DSM 10555 / JCM 9379 / NBRC 101784 / NCIMB 13414 / VKM Ac-1990 / NM-1) TaxID=1032480 RepID=F5XLA8_MICPN|nr:ATP-dependent DNA helicase UvrD2 [Microlunatus phosphovorus]BAK36174.1 ATP-dependent DNA helicase UvrD2 [Microlunatus phosphovorus NM-1]
MSTASIAPPRIGGDPELLLAALDPEQRAVATALHGPVAVIAGAGTGKTRAITHRIAYGVAVGAYSPTAVLAVTFTTRAAGEMRGRLQQLGARGVQARTFHSAALRQAQYFWPKAYGGELPSVLDNRMSLVAEAAGRLRVRVDTARLRDLLGEISWAKVSNTTPEDYARVAAPLDRTVSGIDPETVARIFTGYEELKRQRGRIDFEDILLCTAALLAEHDDIRDQVQRTYRHLVVDEYQDVSPLQHRLLELWRGNRSELCVVGDPAQTIHSFAGARADFLTGFARRHPNATVVRLVRDYRSTPQVVGAANAVMRAGRGPTAGGGIDAVELQAQRPPGPEPLLQESQNEADEAAEIADWLAGLAARGVDYREMAVLFRINAQSPVMEQALAERNIPYLVRGGERFYERAEVRQALHALRTQARAITELDGDRPADAVAEVQATLGALGWTEQPPSGAGAVRERWESLAALVAVAEDLAAASAEPIGLPVVVEELERRAQAQHVPSAQGVTVSTLHSAKGLEWDAVALFGIQEGSLPFVLATRPDEVAEERRLLYVGLTRAREHLHVSWSRTRGGGQATRKPSRFLDPLLPAHYRGGAAPSAAGDQRQRRKGTVLAAHCRTCGHALHDAAERKLGRHADCPATYDERTLTLLKEWRKQTSAEEKVPAFCVFTDATLIAIAEARPTSDAALLKIPGLGQAKLGKYGDQVLAILAAET